MVYDNIKSTVTCGRLETFELGMPQFDDGRTRTIRVWLPEGYEADDKSKKYPVLYMHDGQNLFDDYTSYSGEWHIDESITDLMSKGYEATIVVGIDNGGEFRGNELSPTWGLKPAGKEYISNPSGEKYAEFIIKTVKPLIDNKYNTRPERKHTGIGGSSMGGVMSLYMALNYSDYFEYALLFSPALTLYTDDTVDTIINKKTIARMVNLPVLYIYSGDEDGIEAFVDILKDSLIDSGYPSEKIGTMFDSSKKHNEAAWSQYFPIAIKWVSKGV